VGDLAATYPNAEIVVHEKGARHLASPERLMRNARMVYGDALDTLFGEMKPTEAARIRAVEETGVTDLGGGRLLESHYSPGHAKHHVGLLDSLTGDLYVGDAAGVYIPETADVRPATPPPDFDLDTTLASLEKFRSLRPQRLLFAHYGPATPVEEILDRSAEELRIWTEAVREAHDAELDLDHAVAMVKQRTDARYKVYAESVDPALREKWDMLSGPESNVSGILHSLSH
jgi:glyoxylase-like metal-dependent hydrolase (beta-lactamase superfamily II)